MSKRERREEQRKQLERRRRRAARLLERGVTPAEVARRVGVSRTSVHRWGKRLERDGEQGLKRAARLGRPRGLDEAQRARLALALKQGALAQGYATELWTLARVGQLIEKLFSRRYSHSQVWRILCDMGFSPPVEAQALAGTKKNAARQRRTIVFIDESGLSERPTRVRTWAPKGHTPVLQYSFDWEQLSAIAGVSFWRFYFRFFPGSIKKEQVVEFLKALKTQINGKLLIIWDRLTAHRSRLVREFVEAQEGRIQLEFLPGYAPELNPVEYVWGHLKCHELANLCASHIEQVKRSARQRLRSMQRRPALIAAFWKQAELPL